jgi:DNA-binding protein H-NS
MAKAPVNIEDLDVERLDDQELHAMMQRFKDVLNSRFTSRTQEFRDLAREMGFAVTLTKIGKETARRGTRQAQEEDRRRGVMPKYRNPENPTETWAGRGRKPKWVEDMLAKGASMDDLLINRSGTVVAEEISEEADRI